MFENRRVLREGNNSPASSAAGRTISRPFLLRIMILASPSRCRISNFCTDHLRPGDEAPDEFGPARLTKDCEAEIRVVPDKCIYSLAAFCDEDGVPVREFALPDRECLPQFRGIRAEWRPEIEDSAKTRE